MIKRVLCILAFVLVLFSKEVVLADEVVIDGSKEAEETFTNYLAEALGRTPTETDKQLYSTLITTCVSNGYSGAAIMGICGNIAHESSGNIFAIEGHWASKAEDTATSEFKTYYDFELGHTYVYDYSKGMPKVYTNKKTGKTMYGCGHGIIQWSFGRATSLDTFAKESAIAYITVTHRYKSYDMSGYEIETCHIPDAASQVIFLLTADTGFSSSRRETLKSMTNARNAAKYFLQEVERSAGKDDADVIKERSDSADAFFNVVKSCPGVVGSVTLPDSQVITPEDVIGEASDFIESSEYWSEENKRKFSQLVGEMELVGMVGEWQAKDYQKTIYLETRDSLSVGNTTTLVTIGNFIKSGKLTSSKLVNIIMSVCGYVIMLYGVLITIAYIFDRTNQFIEMSLLGLLSFGKWRVADEEDAGVRHGRVYVTAKGIVVRVVVIEAVGVLLESRVLLIIIDVLLRGFGI